MDTQQKDIISFDIEDWFHILDLQHTPDFDRWHRLEGRVVRNVEILLQTLEQHQVTATFFFLGWIAEQYPSLVRLVQSKGHEVASHGFAHQLVYTQTAGEFYNDIYKAKQVLEDITGVAVLGYRAPGFSITKGTPWAFEQIARAGYKYDSSVFPSKRGHGGLSGAPMHPYTIETKTGVLHEFPLSVVNLFATRLCFFGGGYLRLAPYTLIHMMKRIVNHSGRPVIYYLHPREIDPHHPRLPMPFMRRFKSYINLRSTLPKLQRILDQPSIGSFRDHLAH